MSILKCQWIYRRIFHNPLFRVGAKFKPHSLPIWHGNIQEDIPLRIRIHLHFRSILLSSIRIRTPMIGPH